MPQKHEIYNRFMKYLAPGYGEKGSLDDRWNTYKSECSVCKKEKLRIKMVLKNSNLICKECEETENILDILFESNKNG